MLISAISLTAGVNKENVLATNFESQIQNEEITIDFDRNLDFQEMNNLEFSSHGASLVDENKPALIVSNTIKVPIESPDPFLAISCIWEGEAESRDQVQVFIRNSFDGLKWNEWIIVQEDEDIYNEMNVYAGQLIYFEKNTQYTQFRIELQRNDHLESPIVNRIRFVYISPGKTPDSMMNNIDKKQTSPDSRILEQPVTITRTEWGCQDGQDSPNWYPFEYTDVTHLVIHHTAGSNYSADWPAIVRAIWSYHANNNNWGDIGYNFLIDPEGVLYEGRAGGDNVIGAHFSGHNGNTMGVGMIGTYSNTPPTLPAQDRLNNLFAWKCEHESIDPLNSSYHVSSGLNLNNICGHRDGGATACPGDVLYSQLGVIRVDVNDIIENSERTVIIDNSDASFEQHGPSEYWWTSYGGGSQNNSFIYTYCTDDASPGNWGQWNISGLSEGSYEIEVYVPLSYDATAELAVYQIRHNNMTEDSPIVNQNTTYGDWVSLGEYYFSSYGDQYVRLNDNTGEPYSGPDGPKLAFDAIRLTDMTPPTGSVQVSINPYEVREDAWWRSIGPDGDNTWRSHDYTESGHSEGYLTIEYNSVTGWNSPDDDSVYIIGGETTNTTGTYTEELQPSISLTPASHDFGDQTVGTSSSGYTFTLTSTGNTTATGSISISGSDPGEFQITSGGGYFSLNEGETRSINVVFHPNSTGYKYALLSADGYGDCNDDSSILEGTGVAAPIAHIEFSPASYNYGEVQTNSSASHTFVLENTGTATATGSINLSGGDSGQFQITSGGGGFSLPEGQTMNIMVEFGPDEVGDFSAYLNADAYDPCNDTSSSLTGTGIAVPTPYIVLNPLNHDFNDQVINTSSSEVIFTLENIGDATASGVVSLIGDHPSQFQIASGSGPFELLQEQSLEITVLFHPTSLGEKIAVLDVNGSGSCNDDNSPISGTGVADIVYKLPFPDGVIMGITNGYGDGYHEPGGPDHFCVDFNINGSGDAGIPVLSISNGTVESTYWSSSYGWRVMVDHGNGIVSNYSHGSSIVVEQGDMVNQGQELMVLWDTGWADGYHLHFGIRENGESMELPTMSGYTQWEPPLPSYESDNVTNNPGVIIEEYQAELSGSGFDGNAVLGHNNNYSWKTAVEGDPTMTLTYRPSFSQQLICDVLVYIPPDHATATAVPYTINHLNGLDIVTVNQYSVPPIPSRPDNWYLLGTYEFGIGSSYYVQVGNSINNFASEMRVGYDAIYFKINEGGGAGTDERIRVVACNIEPEVLFVEEDMGISLSLENFGDDSVTITDIETTICQTGSENWDSPLYSDSDSINLIINSTETEVHSYSVSPLLEAGSYDLLISIQAISDTLAFWAQTIEIISLPVAVIPYTTGFEEGHLDQFWSSQSSNEYGRIQVTDQYGPHSGIYHLTLDTTAPIPTQNEVVLRLNLLNEEDVNLIFWWKSFDEDLDEEDGIFISDNDGIDYYKIFDFITSGDLWNEVFIDLDDMITTYGLSYSDQFVVKIQQMDDMSISADGIAIDDLKVMHSIPAPINLEIVWEDNHVVLTFDSVPDVSSYKIYASENPYTDFEEIIPAQLIEIDLTVYCTIIDVTESMMFYRVSAYVE